MDFYRWVRTQWDRAAAIVLVVVGIVALILGWVGVSGATLPTEQLPYLSSDGLFGLFALGVAATLWLSADLRDEWRKLDDIHRELRIQHHGQDDDPLTALTTPAPTPAAVKSTRRATAGAGRERE